MVLTRSSQRMVYNVFQARGYPTKKTQRDEFLKRNLSGQPGFGAIGSSSGPDRMFPGTTSVQANEIYAGSSHPSTSSAIAAGAPTSMIQSLGVRWISEHSHIPDEGYGTGPADTFGCPTELEPSRISNGPDLTTMGDRVAPWTAELAQRQTSFSTFLDMTDSIQMAQSSNVDSNSFNVQSWSNNGTLSGFNGEQHDPPLWDQQGLSEHHDYGAHATTNDCNTMQLSLLAEPHSGIG